MAPAAFFEKRFKKFFWNIVNGILPERHDSKRIPARSVLAFRPDRLGDFVLSVSALSILREQLGKEGRWTLVAGERNEALARFWFPEARVWVFRKNIFSRMLLWLRLWVNAFDAAIDFHSFPFSTTSALMTLVSGAPLRIGFWASGDFVSYAKVSRKIFNGGIKAPNENLSEVEKSLQLVKRLFPGIKKNSSPPPWPSCPPTVKARVEEFYRQIGVSRRSRVLGIHPTLQKSDNRWSQERYVELIRGLRVVKGLKIIIVHGQGEEKELDQFQKRVKSFSNLFALPTEDLFFILEAARQWKGLICNDSGLMHLCAWVTPIFAVFGPSNAKRWGPQSHPGVEHHLFQARDGRCDSVQPPQVVQAVRKILF